MIKMEFFESIENDTWILNDSYEQGLISKSEYLTQMAEIQARIDFYCSPEEY